MVDPLAGDELGDCDWKPKQSMEFKSEQEAFDFYNHYGGRVGFSIRRDYRNKKKHTGEVTSSVFVCNKEGSRCPDKRDHLTKKIRQEVRTGCMARLGIKLARSVGTSEEFQDEFEKSLEACMEDPFIDGEVTMYKIIDDDGKWRIVRKELDDTLTCSCSKFELKGIMCSHTIKVLREGMQIMEVPSQYILKRWTKKARSETVKDWKGHDIQADIKLHQTGRYRSLCSLFTRIASRASVCEQTYDLSVGKGKELMAAVESFLSSRIEGEMQTNDVQTHPFNACEGPSNTCEGNNEINCENTSNLGKIKGLKKRASSYKKGKRRVKSALEIALARNKKKVTTAATKKKALQEKCPTVPTFIPGDVYIPQPPPFANPQDVYIPPPPSFAIPQHPSFAMADNSGCSPFMGYDVLNSMPWMASNQTTSFQQLLQYPADYGYGYPFQYSQASNNPTSSQVID